MPQLEIHHADGNVTFAELSQDKPLMIGSGSNCDVVLSGPEVKRVHCRIAWRDDRWRIEVAADAEGVRVGNKNIKAGTIKAGDIIGIAGYRIYMDAGKAELKPETADEHPAYSSALADSPAGAMDSEPEVQVLGRSRIRKTEHLKDQRSFWRRLWEGIRRTAKEQVQGEIDRPPGQERILGSPLVRWMGLGVLLIVVLGVLAFIDYRNRTIQGHFDKAQQQMTAGNFDGAIRLFDSFLQEYPNHKLASNARVQRAMCEVENVVSTTPTGAMGGLRKMIREQSKEPAFPPIVPKLTDLVGRVAQSLAEAARDKSDAKIIDQCLEAQEVLERDLSGARLPADMQEKLDKTIEQARAAIKKVDDLVSTRETMDRAIQAGTTPEAYGARERFVQLYGEFAENQPEILQQMDRAIQQDRERVQWDGASKNAETQPRASAIVASTSLVDLKGRAAGTAASDNVQFVLVGGVCYAVDGSSGKVLWKSVVGNNAQFLPLTIPGAPEATVLLTDTRHDELAAVRSRTGQLVWRQPLGEPLEAAPLIHRGKIYQPTGKGNLVVIDPNTGRIDGRLQFGSQRLPNSPVTDKAGDRLYLLGEQFILYQIKLGVPPRCEAVYYLAHRPDSIIASPLRMDRYLILFENATATQCQIRVFLIKPDGAKVEEIQQPKPPLNGWVHTVPTVLGNLMFIATDLETVEVFSGGPPEKAEGFKKVTSAAGGTMPPGTRPQAHALAYTDKDLLVAGSKVRHYDYKAEQQLLTPSQEKLAGAASQPIQRYPATGRCDALYVARRLPSSSAILFSAIDAASLEPRWEIQLGTGLLSLTPADSTSSAWVALTRDGQLFSIPSATLTSGGVLEKPASRVEGEIQLSDKVEPVLLPDGSSLYTSSGDANRAYIRGAGANAPLRPLELPAGLKGAAVVFDDGILIPGADGRIYLVSPATGKQLAEPFQPPLQSDHPLVWRGIGLTAKKTIVATDDRGSVYQVELRKEPLVHLSERGKTNLPKAVRSSAVLAGNILCCVDEDNILHSLDAEALTPIGQWTLPAPASLGPLTSGGYVFVVAGDDELVCVNPQGQEAWRHPLKGQTVTGRPLVKAEAVHYVTTSGMVRALRLSDGSELWTLDAEIPLASGPVSASQMFVVVGDDGSLNVVKTPAAAN